MVMMTLAYRAVRVLGLAAWAALCWFWSEC